MEFGILGPLEVRNEGGLVSLRGARQRALLTILVLHANEVVAAARLIDLLWGDRPPMSATKALQVHISQLRQLLGDGVIATKAPGYALQIGVGQLDLERFQDLVAEAGALEAEAALPRLREALSLWRGPPLAEFAHERFAAGEILRLEEIHLDALEKRIEAEIALGQHAGLVGELEALVADHPLREELRAQLMIALYRSGRQAEALATYQDARRALAQEPMPERKLATVLFVDLVGSTELGEQDPERTRALLERYYDAVAAEIESAGGTLEKFAGDAVLAT